MIKRYYIEETDGKETKRTLTTFNDLDDMRNYSDIEIQEMFYEATAESVSKAHKVELLYNEIMGRHHEGESDFNIEILVEGTKNRQIAADKLIVI